MNALLKQIKEVTENAINESSQGDLEEVIDYFKNYISENFLNFSNFQTVRIKTILKPNLAQSVVLEAIKDFNLDSFFKKDIKISTDIFKSSLLNGENFYLKLTQIKNELCLIYICENGDSYLILDEDSKTPIDSQSINDLNLEYFTGRNAKGQLLNRNLQSRRGLSTPIINTKKIMIQYNGNFESYADNFPKYLVLAPCIYNEEHNCQKEEYKNRFSYVMYLTDGDLIDFTNPGNAIIYDNFCINPPDKC